MPTDGNLSPNSRLRYKTGGTRTRTNSSNCTQRDYNGTDVMRLDYVSMSGKSKMAANNRKLKTFFSVCTYDYQTIPTAIYKDIS